MSSRSAVLARPSKRAPNSALGDFRSSAERAREAMLKSFKIHLAIYLPVNLLLIGMWGAGGGGFWPVWPILGWGLFGVPCGPARRRGWLSRGWRSGSAGASGTAVCGRSPDVGGPGRGDD